MLTKFVHIPGFIGDRRVPLKRLYRYMPLDACVRMVERGEVRISSSTNFSDDEELSETRKDDEQSKSVSTVASEIIGTSRVPKGFGLEVHKGAEVDGGTRVKLRSHVEDSYWILALSTDLSCTLFDEFKENAAVEIHEPEEYFRRLENASHRLLFPRDIFGHDHIEYANEYIGYGRTAIEVSPFFHKSSRYRTQKEYRVVWHPRRTATTHEYLYLGRLDDIVNVVRRKDVESGATKEVRFPEDAIAKYRRNNTPTFAEQMQGASVRNL